MKQNDICQSCGMPLDKAELYGTNKDGTVNLEYCRHCYHDGKFTNSDITLTDMKQHLLERMEKMNMDDPTIVKVINRLQFLNRWANKN